MQLLSMSTGHTVACHHFIGGRVMIMLSRCVVVCESGGAVYFVRRERLNSLHIEVSYPVVDGRCIFNPNISRRAPPVQGHWSMDVVKILKTSM